MCSGHSCAHPLLFSRAGAKSIGHEQVCTDKDDQGCAKIPKNQIEFKAILIFNFDSIIELLANINERILVFINTNTYKFKVNMLVWFLTISPQNM